MSLKIVPKAVSIRACSMVSYENVVRMGDPEASRGLISVQKTPRSDGLDDKVVNKIIVRLHGIFNEESVAFYFVCDIFFKPQVVSSM